MTNKDIIRTLSHKGYGYKKIAKELNISVGSVRNALIEVTDAPVCKNCGGKLKFIEGKKKKVFCSDACRYDFWNKRKKR
jgi:hypothetical protein